MSWWVRSRSRVCSGADVRVILWSEVSSSGSECPTPDAGSRGCSWALCHKYWGLFCGYEMVEDSDSDNLRDKL